jgi:hypothetical protein
VRETPGAVRPDPQTDSYRSRDVPRLIASPTELTTAATDAVLGLVCLAIVVRLATMRVRATWKRDVWCWVFGLLALGSLLGAWAHGFELSDSFRGALWRPLYLSLGLTVALFVVGGIYDWRGEAAARALLPGAVALGVIFFALTQWLSGAFLVFVAYEAIAMLATLAMYVVVSVRGHLAGARMMAAGIALSIVAAAVQASTMKVRLIVPLDHNGLFHLVQLIATGALAAGLQRGLHDRVAPVSRRRRVE